MPARWAAVVMLIVCVPLWPTIETLPPPSFWSTSEWNLTPRLRLYTPMQLGPTIGIPSAFAISTIASCSFRPSSWPVSAKPAVKTAMPPTPFLIASLTM